MNSKKLRSTVIISLFLVFFISFAVNSKTIAVCNECNFNSIQKAINATEPGETITVSEGIYEENLIIDKDLTLKGQGESKTLIVGESKGYPVVKVGPSEVRVSISNLSFKSKGGECKSTAICPSGILLEGKAQASLNRLNIDSSKFGAMLLDATQIILKNSTIDHGTVAILLYSSAKVTMLNSTINRPSMSGIKLNENSCAQIENSTITNSFMTGISVSRQARARLNRTEIKNSRLSGLSLSGEATIDVKNSNIYNNSTGLSLEDSDVEGFLGNNSIKKNKTGIYFSSDKNPEKVLTGFGNEISDNKTNFEGVSNSIKENILKSLSVSEKKSLTESPIIVSKNNNDFSSIQSAIDIAKPGNTILLRKGTYKENLVIDKNLTIKAEENKEVVIEGIKKNSPVVEVGPGNGVNVKIEGVTIKGPGGKLEDCNLEECGYVIVVKGAANIEVNNSEIVSNYQSGLGLRNYSGSTIKNTSIRSKGIVGVHLVANSEIKVENSTIEESDGALALEDNSEANIKSTFCKTEIAGMSLIDESQLSLNGTIVKDNKEHGLAISGASQVYITNSEFRKNGTGIISRNSSQVKIISSKIEDNVTGIVLDDQNKTTLIENKIDENKVGLVLVAPYKGNIKKYENEITNNIKNYHYSSGDLDGISEKGISLDEIIEKGIYLDIFEHELYNKESMSKPEQKNRVSDIDDILTDRYERLGFQEVVIAPLGDSKILTAFVEDFGGYGPNLIREINRTGLLEMYKVVGEGPPGQSLSPNSRNQEVMYGRAKQNGDRIPYLVQNPPLMSEVGVKSAKVRRSQRGENPIFIGVELNSWEARKFADIITNLEPDEDRIATTIDNLVLFAAVISQGLWDNAQNNDSIERFAIEGDYGAEEAKLLTAILESGALPKRIHLIKVEQAELKSAGKEIKHVDKSNVELNFSFPGADEKVKGFLFSFQTEGDVNLKDLKNYQMFKEGVQEMIGWQSFSGDWASLFIVPSSVSNEILIDHIRVILEEEFNVKGSETSFSSLTLTKKELRILRNNPSVKKKPFTPNKSK